MCPGRRDAVERGHDVGARRVRGDAVDERREARAEDERELGAARGAKDDETLRVDARTRGEPAERTHEVLQRDPLELRRKPAPAEVGELQCVVAVRGEELGGRIAAEPAFGAAEHEPARAWGCTFRRREPADQTVSPPREHPRGDPRTGEKSPCVRARDDVTVDEQLDVQPEPSAGRHEIHVERRQPVAARRPQGRDQRRGVQAQLARGGATDPRRLPAAARAVARREADDDSLAVGKARRLDESRHSQ